jgi:hypothetical protein
MNETRCIGLCLPSHGAHFHIERGGAARECLPDVTESQYAKGLA